MLILIAAAPRVAGVYSDFWLDEIWSWRIAANLAHPWQVFTHPVALSDNNHPLNTLLMWSIGHNPHSAAYRVPALAAGIGSIFVVALILRRRGTVDSLVGVALVGSSYPLIVYSSEARGYALAVFFALVAFDALERFLRSRGWLANCVFVGACVLGIVSHLTFAYFYLGALAWSVCRWARERRGGAEAFRCHLVPLAVLAALWAGFVRSLTIGGAPEESTWRALITAAGGLLGAGASLVAAIGLASVAILLFVWSLIELRRRRDDLWLFLIVAVIVAPIVIVGGQLLLSTQRQPIAARYFLVPFVFLLFGIATLLSDWLRRGHGTSAAAGVILLAFVVVNMGQTIPFLRIGRGHYQEAILEMSLRTPHPFITVLSDHPLRTAMVLDFYQSFLSPHQELVIYDGSSTEPVQFTHGPPMWLIVHSNKRGEAPDQFPGFVFDRELPYYGLSGYSWYLYRHESIR